MLASSGDNPAPKVPLAARQLAASLSSSFNAEIARNRAACRSPTRRSQTSVFSDEPRQVNQPLAARQLAARGLPCSAMNPDRSTSRLPLANSPLADVLVQR
jgi:hypothetical protein